MVYIDLLRESHKVLTDRIMHCWSGAFVTPTSADHAQCFTMHVVYGPAFWRSEKIKKRAEPSSQQLRHIDGEVYAEQRESTTVCTSSVYYF